MGNRVLWLTSNGGVFLVDGSFFFSLFSLLLCIRSFF